MDIEATRHICSDKKMFSSYEAINDGEQLFMGNSSTSKVEGKGKVILKMTSGKDSMMCCMFQKFGRILYLDRCRVRRVLGWFLSPTNLYSLRVGFM